MTERNFQWAGESFFQCRSVRTFHAHKIIEWLGNREYVIEANLLNVLIKEEDIQRESIRLFLDFKSSSLTGGFHTSGSKFGGKETMALSGTDIKLSRVMPKTDE